MTSTSPSSLRDIAPMYIFDLLLGLEPWFNITIACSVAPQTTTEYSSRRNGDDDMFQSDIPITFVKPSDPQFRTSNSTYDVNDYVGTYGHFGYGNVTVYVNQSTGQLMMSYGPLAKWVLLSTEISHDFTGRAEEPLWYWTLEGVTFSKSAGNVFDQLDVPFDNAMPTIFVRGLLESSAPAPPELCP